MITSDIIRHHKRHPLEQALIKLMHLLQPHKGFALQVEKSCVEVALPRISD